MGPGADQSFGPKKRILKRKEFLSLGSRAKKSRTEHFLVLFSSAKKGGAVESESRLGITVTTKISKRAVKRNRLKRRVRHLFRTHSAEFVAPVDLVVIALTGATELNFSQITEELCVHRKRIESQLRNQLRK